MKPETLKALKGSIAKWQAIVDGTGLDQGPKNCPLCQLFWKPLPGGGLAADACEGCPVYEDTGLRACAGTPYDDWEDDDSEMSAKDAATAELEYLRSLLPRRARRKQCAPG